MMPAYRSMDSYPYQRSQMPFPHYYHPGIEAIPPQMKVDPSKPPFSYDQRCPYAGSYVHALSPHFCCGHNNFPCHYSYMPSHPHAPSPMYYSGGCPQYSEPYFVPYSSQPNYTMELPRYEYDKYMPREHHCCGCSNHPWNQKEGKSVKIEEQEPDGGNKVNDALVPVQLKNYPYPVVWIPQEYTSNKQLKNPNTIEGGEQNKPPSLENSNVDAQPAQEPRVWNGWFPLNIKGAPKMIHDGYGKGNQKQESGNNRGQFEDRKMDQKHQSEQKRSEFPFPIFWLPYYNKQEESGETNNQENTSSQKIIEEVPHTFKFVPVKAHVDQGGMKGTRSNQAEYTKTNVSDIVEKVTNARNIPVKQIESHQGKNVSLDQMEENVTKKDSSTGDKKRQSTSSPKGSKLPPVCLRVDPPPRKKNGNGSSSSSSRSRSRSLSPPSSKGHSQDTAGETFKTLVCGTNDNAQPNSKHQNAPNTSEKVEPKEKIIQVSELMTNDEKGVDSRDRCQSQINVDRPSEGAKEKRETCADSYEIKTEDKKANKGEEKMMEETTELRGVKESSAKTAAGRKQGRVLSDADAVVLIQAAYRGYQVRKWEPLKKLKQIREVRKEVTNVRDRVQTFERSSDLQNDDKQKIAIGETIMRLLLKLDTIQGLHPSFREIRKSLARELTILQERLDSIMAMKPEQQVQDFDVQKHVEVTPMNMHDEEHVRKQQEEKVVVPGDSSEGDVKSPRADDGGSESQSPVDPASNEGAEPVVLPNGLDNEDASQVVTTDTLNSTSDLTENDKMAVEPEAKSKANDIPIEIDELNMTICEELPVGVIDEDINDVSIEKEEHDDVSSENLPAMVNDSARDELDSMNHAMMELPVGLLDEDERDSERNISKGETKPENEILIEELPVGLLDENAEESEVKKHVRAKSKTSEEVLLAQEGECNADEKTSSSTDDDAKETQLEQQQKLEEQDEVISSGESDGWVKIEFQNEGEFKGDAPMEIGVEFQSGEEVGTDIELPPLITQVNSDEPGNEDLSLQANDVNKNNLSHEPMEFVLRKEEPEEKIAQRETQEKVAERAMTADDKNTETLAQKKAELSEAPPALLEENEKLREMIKKLLGAGNEQLSVISDLTGRVKDLEKKLAKSRSKRLKTKRYRSTTSKMSLHEMKSS